MHACARSPVGLSLSVLSCRSMLEGLPEHSKRLEEAGSQLSAAVAAGATAEQIADQEDRLYALYTELSVAAEGAITPSLPSATAPGVTYTINRHVAACQKPPTYEQHNQK